MCGALGADDFVEIEPWGKAKLQWLRQFLRPEHGIASHDAFGQVFAAIDAEQFAAAFRRWVRSVLPALGIDEVVSVDVKSSRRSGGAGSDGVLVLPTPCGAVTDARDQPRALGVSRHIGHAESRQG